MSAISLCRAIRWTTESRDLRELLEIQTSLPMANQPAEYLKGVPVGLLRLLPEREEPTTTSTSTSSTTTNKTVSPIAKEWNSISFKAPHHRPTAKPTPPSYSRPLFVQPPPCPRPVRSPWTPAHLAHLAPAKVMEEPRPRERPRFTFVPLLDPAASPSPSSSVPSSAEPSRAPSPVFPQPSSSLSLSPLSLSLSVSDHPELCHSMDTDTEDGGPPTPGGFGSAEPTLPPPSPLVLEKKKRRFIVVNDMEIPLDDD